MGLDLSLSGFISAGGGLAYSLVAILWAASTGRPRHRLLLAGLVGAQGIGVVVQSLTTPEETGPVTGAAMAGPYLLAAAGALTALFAAALSLALAAETSRRSVVAVSGALATLTIMAFAFLLQGGITPGKGDPAAMPAFTRIVFAILLVGYAASAVVVLAMGLHWKRHAARGAPVLAFATAVLPVGFLVANAERSIPEALLAALALACLLGWLPPWGRGAPRVGRTVVLTLLGWALFMEVYYLVPFLRARFGPALFPFEVAAALAMAIALLRQHVWSIQPPRVAQRRGALAAAALAALFIAAQVGQNLLTAEYGLLIGGAVAGAFLFAAHPIQRAMETLVGPGSPRASGTAGARPRSDGATSAHEAYRRAVRLSLRGGALSPADEVELGHVAHELGLTAPESIALRHEVEDEWEARG